MGPGNGNQCVNHPDEPSVLHPGAEEAGKEAGLCLADTLFQSIHIHEGQIPFIIVGINGAQGKMAVIKAGMGNFFMLRPVSVAYSQRLQGVLFPVLEENAVIHGIHIMKYMVHPLLLLMGHTAGNVGHPDFHAGFAVALGNDAAGGLHELIPHKVDNLMHLSVGHAFVQTLPKRGGKLQGGIIDILLRLLQVVVPQGVDHGKVGFIGEEIPDGMAVIGQESHGFIGLEIDHADGIIVSLPGPGLNLQSLLHAVVKAFLIGHGLSEEITLHLFAAVVLQKLKLFLRFHPLRQAAGADSLIHGNDGTDNVSGPFAGASQKGHVDFQHIKGIVLQQVQGRIAAAEIIHPDFIARLPEPPEALPYVGVPGSEQSFRDFNMNHVPGHIVLQHPVLHFLENIALQEIQAGQVHRYRHHRTPLVHAAGKILTHLPYDFQIQLMNLPAVLQGGNEIRRLEKSLLRILPPGQGLHAAEGAGNGPHNGLVIGFDISFFHGFVHMAGHIVLQLHLLVQVGGVIGHETVSAVVDAVTGNLHPGHCLAGVGSPAAKLVNACLAFHLGGRTDGEDTAVGLPDLFLQIPVLRQHHEMIHINAGNHMARKHFLEAMANLLKEGVPLRNTVGHIEKLEMDDVEKQKGIPFRMAAVLHNPLRLRQEAPHAWKSGDVVHLIGRQPFIQRRYKKEDQRISCLVPSPLAHHIHLPPASISCKKRTGQAEPSAGHTHLVRHILLHRRIVPFKKPRQSSAGKR